MRRLPTGREPGSGGRWLILLADDEQPVEASWDLVIEFSGASDADGYLSLPRFLYEHRSELATSAANEINALAEAICDRTGLTVRESLDLGDGLSFWDLSGANEKCIVRNPELGSYLKCLALEKLLAAHRPAFIKLSGDRAPASTAILGIARSLGIECSIPARYQDRNPGRALLVQRVRALARFASLALDSVQMAWLALKGPRQKEPQEPGLAFVSYSDNVNTRSTSFSPLHWPGIPDLIRNSFRTVHWLHLYDRGGGISRPTMANRFRKLGLSTGAKHRVLLLEAGLRPSSVALCFFQYLRLQLRLHRVEHALDRSVSSRTPCSPWPFLVGAWDRSTRGGASASLLVQARLLKLFAEKYSNQQAVFYLLEGMAWERALLHYWRREGDRPIFGYQHATLKSFDLRLLSYPTSASACSASNLPDRILVNGPTAFKAFRSYGFDAEVLHEVEALRFGYLGSMRSHAIGTSSGPGRIAVILEGLYDADRFILELIRQVQPIPGAARTRRFFIKPHPSGRVQRPNWIDGEDSTWEASTAEMRSVLLLADTVCCSINSSAVLEARAMGKPLVLLWKPDELVRTPLDLSSWESVASSGEQLEALLRESPDSSPQHFESDFCIDPALPRWNALLNSLDRPGLQ